MATPLTADWVEKGLCRTHPNPDQWFPRRHDNKTARLARVMCRQCPVIETCLYEALNVEDTYGIWGGTDEEERAEMRRNRGARVA